MNRLYITIVLTAALFAGCAPRGDTMLPAPTGLPEGPQGVDVPAASIAPLSDRVAPGSPAIATIGPTAGPNDTLVVSGVDLDGARLRLWAGAGFPVEVEPLRTDDDQLVAIVPPNLPPSTMLVWPVKNGRSGAPIRVNGPDLWWAWPPRVTAGDAEATLRLFGRNFKLAVSKQGAMEYRGLPRVALDGPGGTRRLELVRSAHCHVEAALPDDLEPGRYWAWIHNGTGGRFGWSEPVAFSVVAPKETKEPVVVRADDFGAVADDNKDDTAALRHALDEVAAQQHHAPVILRLGAGTYHIDRPLKTFDWAPFGGVTIEGVGMGGFDEATLTPKGRHTTLAVTPGDYLPERMLEIVTPGATVRKLNLVMGGCQRAREMGLCLLAPDITVEQCRFVCLDRRPRTFKREPTMNQPPLYVNAPGKANIEIRDCEFYFPGPGIQIGLAPPGHQGTHGPPPSSDYIRIAGCAFRGTYTGPLDTSPDWLPPGISGAHSRGVSNYNGKNVIVERCDFAGLDKDGGKILGRIVRCGNTSIRHQYFAENTATEIGPHSSIEGINHNLGELYLFHLMYPHGGLFDVIEADAEFVTAATGNLENARHGPRGLGVTGPEFSQIIDDVGASDHWILYIYKGRGVGQYRVVDGLERLPGKAVFRVRRPWRVTPDRTSRVVLTVAYRENIVHNNVTDAGEYPNDEKTQGVLFWYNAFDNLVADNTFRNVSGGVTISSLYRNPTGFNQVIGNRFESLLPWKHPKKGETTRPFVAEQFQVPETGWADPEDRAWYSIGNTFRGNTGRDGSWVASLRHTYLSRDVWPEPVPHPDSGLMMSVLEHNAFSGVPKGIRIAEPANWTVIRGNAIELTDPDAPIVNVTKPQLKSRIVGGSSPSDH